MSKSLFSRLSYGLAVIGMLGLLSACGDEGPAEEVGEAADEAAEEASEAAEETGEAVEEAGEEAQQQ